MRTQRLSAARTTLPSYPRVAAALEAAERGEGWLVRCEAEGRYLALSSPFVEALAGLLRSLDAGPVLEICAGDGSLAAALRGHGVEVTATDRSPAPGRVRRVEALDAGEALRRYRPRTVLGSFVPFDAGIDRQVLDTPSVRSYVVLNARLGGQLGPAGLWTHPGWTCTPLDTVTRWMLCRHDVWLGAGRAHLRHGEAWLFTRVGAARAG